jgi:hypothetical protein
VDKTGDRDAGSSLPLCLVGTAVRAEKKEEVVALLFLGVPGSSLLSPSSAHPWNIVPIKFARTRALSLSLSLVLKLSLSLLV